MVAWGSWFVESEHPRGRGGKWTEKGGPERSGYQRISGRSAMRIAQHAAKAFAGGRTTKPMQVFRRVGENFAKTLAGLKPGAKIMRADTTRTLLRRPAEASMRIMLPKGTSATFNQVDLAVDLPLKSTLLYEGKDDKDNYVFRKVGGVAVPKLKVIEALPPDAPLRGTASGTAYAVISPISRKGKEGDERNYYRADLASMKGQSAKVGPDGKPTKMALRHQQAFADNMALFKSSSFPMRKSELRGKTPDQIAAIVQRRMEDNIRFLYDNATKEEMEAKRWYPGAHAIMENKAQATGYDVVSVTACFAALSAQQDWDQNISLGNRLIDIHKAHQNTRTTDKMKKMLTDIIATEDEEAKSKNRPVVRGAITKLSDKLRGATLAELTNPEEKAAWIKLYDLAHNSRSFKHYNPDNTEDGTRMTRGGEEERSRWYISNREMGKAIACLESKGDRNKINGLLYGEKVRSFYNCIVDPFNDNGDLVNDTHAIGAAWMRPFSGTKDQAVANGLGTNIKSEKKPKDYGLTHDVDGAMGHYGLYADAYRAVAKRLGIRPSELQAVVWTVKRNTLSARDLSKTDVEAMDNIWKDYQNGEIEFADAQKKTIAIGRKRQDERASAADETGGKGVKGFG
jgi:hypothetical protein